MKDAARLLIYLVASVLLAVVIAPPLFWSAHALAPALVRGVDFESFFHRALLIALVALLWPLLRSTRIRRWPDLGLQRNPRWLRDALAGFSLAALPLLCGGVVLLLLHWFALRHHVNGLGVAKVLGATLAVPLIEETFFRGLVLGLLIRAGARYLSIFLTSAFFAIVHFLKAPDSTSTVVTWHSGFDSIAHAFAPFRDAMFVVAAFTTLFLIGWILAEARVRTASLWLPIGLHAGWIFGSGVFNQVARYSTVALPWVGKSLLVGIVPLALGGVTWLLMLLWLKTTHAHKA